MLMDNTKVNAWAPDKQFVAPTDISSIQVQQSVAGERKCWNYKQTIFSSSSINIWQRIYCSYKERCSPTEKENNFNKVSEIKFQYFWFHTSSSKSTMQWRIKIFKSVIMTLSFSQLLRDYKSHIYIPPRGTVQTTHIPPRELKPYNRIPTMLHLKIKEVKH